MTLNHLKYFQILAHAEHYTRAAETLSISQPALSRAISSMEQELGVRLFEKQGRNVRLTKSGRLYLPFVEQALEVLTNGQAQLSMEGRNLQGQLHLGHIPALAPPNFPPSIQSFVEDPDNRSLALICQEGVASDLLDQLLDDRLDAILVTRTQPAPGVEYLPVCEQSLVLLTPLNHPLAGCERLRLHEVARYSFVFPARGSGLRILLDQLFGSHSIQPLICREAESQAALVGLVTAGMGIALAIDAPALHTLPVRVLELEDSSQPRCIYLGYVKNRKRSPVAQRFLYFVQQRARQEDGERSVSPSA